MIETIWLTLIAALPSLAAIFTIIAAVVKMTKNNSGVLSKLIDTVNALSIEIKNTKEMDDMKTQMRALLESNRALQNRYDELLTEVTKIKHGEE